MPYAESRISGINLRALARTVRQDLRYGARMLYRNVGFTIVAIFALALGIGVNTAVFTAYKAFFSRSLDVRDPGKMVNLALTLPLGAGVPVPYFSYPDYEDYRDYLHSFTGVIAMSDNEERLTFSGVGGTVSRRTSAPGSLMGRMGLLSHTATSDAEFASAYIVSENYFSVLGVAALRGRTFETVDSLKLATSPPALISENYWQRRFAGDPSLIGDTILLNGVAFTVIGITPHDFVGTKFDVPNFWLPLKSEPLLHADEHALLNREKLCCRLFARLAPGIDIGQAQAEVTLLADRLSTLHDPHSELGKPIALLWPGSPFPLPLKMYGGLQYAILLIMAAVGMVLVVACANVASLQLARASSRQNELGTRLSLGASRQRLIRQLLTESALMGLLAGVIALFCTWALLRVLITVAADSFPTEYGTLILRVTPDLEIFGYVFAISLVAGVLFGLAPALESSRFALSSALRASTGISSVRGRVRDALIAAQVVVSLTFMITGSMLIRSANQFLKVDLGYDSKHVVRLDLQFPEGAKYTAERKVALGREIRTRLAALPNVAAITNGQAPNGGGPRVTAVPLNGDGPSAQNARMIVRLTYVQANYFETLGIPLIYGRSFQSQTDNHETSVVLSESAAKRLWPGLNPIGRSVRLETDDSPESKGKVLSDGLAYQIVGVARDTLGYELNGSASEQVYVPLPDDRLQDYPTLIRTKSAQVPFVVAISPVISAIDPNLVATAYTLEEMLLQTPTFITSSFAAAIASTVGLLGLLLTSMGIYGTVSYVVVLRTREVGIRVALGAKKRDILELILRQSMRPVLGGLLVGVSLAVGAFYLLRGVLHGLRTIDSLSLVGVSLLFLAIALVAAYLPSRRAMRVDPVAALRCE